VNWLSNETYQQQKHNRQKRGRAPFGQNPHASNVTDRTHRERTDGDKVVPTNEAPRLTEVIYPNCSIELNPSSTIVPDGTLIIEKIGY
jgi:hypothetical protein